jgi:hypothetical protein
MFYGDLLLSVKKSIVLITNMVVVESRSIFSVLLEIIYKDIKFRQKMLKTNE